MFNDGLTGFLKLDATSHRYVQIIDSTTLETASRFPAHLNILFSLSLLFVLQPVDLLYTLFCMLSSGQSTAFLMSQSVLVCFQCV